MSVDHAIIYEDNISTYANKTRHENGFIHRKVNQVQKTYVNLSVPLV